MITTIISIIGILVFFNLFYKLQYGIATYMLYIFLVPMEIYIFGHIVGLNVALALMLFLLLGKQINKYYGNDLKPFLFLFLAQACLIPLHFSEEPIMYQINSFRIDLMTLICPFAILCTATDKKIIKIYNLILYLVIFISTIYGLSLLTMIGQNPYMEIVNSITSKQSLDQTNVLEEGVRLFGYIESVFGTVTSYGIFLILSAVYVFYDLQKNEKKLLPIIALTLITTNIIVCGSRSVLMGYLFCILFYLLLKRQYKSLLYTSLVALFTILLIIEIMPEYMVFVKSFGSSDYGGSSFEMRDSQFVGCFQSIKDNVLFGNGYGWTGWYRNEIGRHPIMLSFESILIQILCNGGLTGLFIWLIFVFLYTKRSGFLENTKDENAIIVLVLLGGFLARSFLTGDYGGMRYLLIFYALIRSKQRLVTSI